MKIKVDGKVIDVKPGEPFLSGGKVFGMCQGCGRIIRTDGWLKGIHICD